MLLSIKTARLTRILSITETYRKMHTMKLLSTFLGRKFALVAGKHIGESFPCSILWKDKDKKLYFFKEGTKASSKLESNIK